MKAFKIFLLIILVLMIGFSIAVYVFIKNFDISQFKSQIVEEISSALGREVQIDDIKLDFSLKSGMDFAVTGLKIADHPTYSKENFLEVAEMRLDVDLMALMEEQKVIVSKIHINSPKFILIRSPYNEFNVQKMAHTHETPEAQNQQQEKSAKKKNNISVNIEIEKDPSALLIKSIWLTDGTFIFIDRNSTPEKRIEVTQIDLQINDFSLADPFKFLLKANLGEKRQNFHLNGTVRLDVKNNQVRCDDMHVDVELSEDLLEQAKEYAPFLKTQDTIESLKARVQARLSQIILGPKGILVLTLSGNIVDGRLKLKQLVIPFTNIDMAFDMTDSELIFNNFSMGLGSGEIAGQGRINDYQKAKELMFGLNINEIKIEEILPPKTVPVKIEGNINGRFDIKGEGADEENFLDSLRGLGSIKMTEGKLKDINVLRIMLGKISMLPGLVATVDENLPEKYKRKLQSPDTEINKVDIQTKIGGGRINLTKAEVDADSFTILGDGHLDFDQNASLNGAVYIPADLSKSIIASVPELSVLLDEYDQIYLPLSPYQGKLNKVRMYPDLGYLGQKIIIRKGAEELQKVLQKEGSKVKIPGEVESILEKVLGPQGEQTNKPKTGTPDEAEPAGDKRPEEIIIENIIDTIFQ